MKTYLFYDIETTGLNKAFDQVIQFAAIRTDESFNEIEREEILVKLRKDVIPSPGAIITHRIAIHDLLDGHREIDAVNKIFQMMNTPETISLGYNTLGFDDEFLRFSFYRNLFPPYTHQYASGCGRMDLYPMAIMYKLYKPGVMKWPTKEGKVSLKLENLSQANNLATGQAHDAMVDVEATVALAKVFVKEKSMWDYLAGYFNKAEDQNRTAKLPEMFQSAMGIHTAGLVHSGEFGAEANYMAPAIFIGNSVSYKNQSLWLRLDQPELQKTDEETIRENTWAIRKRFGEPGFILPPEDRFRKHISTVRRETIRDNVAFLKSNPDLFAKIILYHRNFKYDVIPDLDADAALYQNGFLSSADQAVCRDFHQAPFAEKEKIASRIQDPSTQALAIRLLCRNYPDEMTEEKCPSQYSDYLLKINPDKEEDALPDYTGRKRLTPIAALSEISTLKKERDLDPEQIALLDELTGYIEKEFNRNII